MDKVPPVLPLAQKEPPQTTGACVICISSGKGGVGKTSIALSLARELAQAAKVLVVDLDYFNRGATGLLTGRLLFKRKGECLVEVVLGGQSEQAELFPPIHIDAIEKEPNLLFSGCADLSEAAMRRLERTDVTALAERLDRVLLALAESLQLSFIVLDAHGGPDSLSFAAASVSRYTVLVSDPDKVTLYGTLNFVARLREALPPYLPKPRLKLLFNRVSKKFSWRGLTQIYEENLSDLFDGPLLGAVPFLPSVFENFASAPFVSALFPGSLFADKIQLVALDLLGRQEAQRLPPSVRQWSNRKVSRTRIAVHDCSWARPFPITVAWLLVFICSFAATLAVALSDLTNNNLLTSLGMYGAGTAAVLIALLAMTNSLRLFGQGVATNYRFQVHTALAKLYRWKLLLQLAPLVVISLFILVFLGLLLPALASAKAKAQRINCTNNMKQIALAFRVWSWDNADRFPFNVSTNAGGTLQLCARGEDGFDRSAFRHFQVLSNELNTPKLLVCPADLGKQVATDFLNLQSTNVTYELRSGTNVDEMNPDEVLFRCPIHGTIGLCDGSVTQKKK